MMGWRYVMTGGWYGMFVFLILVGIIIYLGIRLSNSNSYVKNGRCNNSLEILNERFARGEIDEDEYRHKKDLLRNK